MSDNKKTSGSSKKEERPKDISANEPMEKGGEVKDQQFLKRWKEGQHKNMGNDISGEIKIANANGELEGGSDKRWHMEEEE